MKKTDKQKDVVYTECVRIWLKEIHPDWTFSAVHGKKMKSIIKKIEHSIKTSPKQLQPTDELVINSFRMLCQRLPDWFKDKDLQVIDSKYNEIVYQIQTGTKKSLNDYNSSHVFSQKYGHLV
jgi:predicted RNase H-like nuclease